MNFERGNGGSASIPWSFSPVMKMNAKTPSTPRKTAKNTIDSFSPSST
jgi:hypothetical protein